MEFFHLVIRHLWRHKVRSFLTIAGVTVALTAFCLIQTMINAWYAGVRASAKDRLIVRNSVSLVFYLPIAYGPKIAQVPGVHLSGYGNWFGGIYKDENYRFAQFAIDENYLEIYPEFQLTPSERKAFAQDRKGAIIGEELATKYGLKVGQVMQIQGTIFPGLWEFTVQGIFRGRDPATRTRTLFFHWDYLNERNRQEQLRQPDQTGFYAVQLQPGADPARVAKAIDAIFANSYAETLTESETAFQQSFVSMSSSIILALHVVSGVVLVIMLLVLSNTIFMSTRERLREYTILRALGFREPQIARIVLGEAFSLTLTGFIVFCFILTFIFSASPATLLGDLAQFFPVFELNPAHVVWSFIFALGLGAFAAAFAIAQLRRTRLIDGLRRVG
jgi:putative ABC transport system permease protein